ncbi:hypothetical protein CFC21_017659 [Triticum aestivum]|uniref:NAC domain-containing protein n=2 Tax=Triticum aestivum TaxID=4565 RepID=A0A3B6B0S9_WHEAT|nr:hypothetical protein CFC21_017659 [Triticum aestivum]
MATPQPAGLALRAGAVFRPSGRQLITLYLGRNALRGELPDAAVIPGGCVVTAGVDVFAASPGALPFQASHRGAHGEVWGYFAAASPTADSAQPAPGGCWVRHGTEKLYELKGEALGYRSRYAFYVTRAERARVVWTPTRWLMKEYRLHKGAAVFRSKLPDHPNANMDFVVRKVFTKPAVPVPPPARSGLVVRRVGGSVPSRQARPTRAAFVKARGGAQPILPCACRGETLRPGGNPLPPRSDRPPKVIAKPVLPAAPLILAPPAHSNEDAGNRNDNAMSWTRVGGECNYNYKVPSGRQIIVEYLGPKATTGKIADRAAPGFVAEGVDIFAASPDALPFPPGHRKQDGEAWGYFFAAKPASSMRRAPGGWWMQYGDAKGYEFRGEVYARHRRFEFRAARADDGGGKVTWEQTRWLMKEYALHKGADAFRGATTGPAGANMDLVVYKVFTKPVVTPPPPPALSSEAENQARKGAGSSSDSDAPRIVFDIDLNN